MMSENFKVIPVKVAVRCRPLVAKEEKEGCQCCLQFVSGEPQIVVGKDKAFTFDFVFGPLADQFTVYEKAVLPLVQGLFKGYNATVLAYGQTGSGKTYSMGGGYGINIDSNDGAVGIIPRVIKDLFVGIKEKENKYEFNIRVSYLELYKEDLFDLFVPLSKRDKDQVVIRDDITGGIKLAGMTECEVRCYEETIKYFEEGSQSRTVGATAMNNQSSRSHAIFTIHMERKNKLDSHDFCKAKFHLVDLAGSERIKKTHAEGERLKEGININKGLLSLGNVISALGEESASRKGHIPYRDSKLTRLLQDSLGGNSHTLMVACISPADSNIEETINTLRYADRARKIKNKPIINQDPQAAEIIRLRQLVQELQAQSSKTPIISDGSIMDIKDGRYRTLIETNRKLEEEKFHLVSELQAAISQNTEMLEKVIKAELARDNLKEKLEEIKETTNEDFNKLLECSGQESDESRSKVLELQVTLMKNVKERISQLEAGNYDKSLVEETFKEEDDKNDQCDSQTEEMRSTHVLRQAQMSRELQDLNNMLRKKQELASHMQANEKELQAMREQYETQMREMENEVEKLQKEREDVMQAMQSLKSNNNNNKLAEQRRKKVQELESQIQQLKKKMAEQMRLLKIKEQSDKQVEKLNQEIIMMKQHRVKLMNQMKDDAEQFRKMKAEMTKEVLQLKSQDRKRQVEIAKMERQYLNQQAISKRKAEEAAAANNRLKEVLAKQKVVQEDRARKMETVDLGGAGTRVRKLINDEMELLVSVEEARAHLEQRISARKEVSNQIHELRKVVEDQDGISDSMADSIKKQLKELEQEQDLCNMQITDLQQKLLDADQDEKSKSRWDNIHTMIEAKCAIKWLLNMAVSLKVESNQKDDQLNDMKSICDELSKSLQQNNENTKESKLQWEQEIHELRKEHESKVLYLLSQLKNPIESGSMSDNEIISELKKRISFQDEEIKKFSRLEGELARRNDEYNALQKEYTKSQYKGTTGRSGSLMPATFEADELDAKKDSCEEAFKSAEFFNPAFCPERKARRRRKVSNQIDELSESDEFEEDDDIEKDPTWRSGLTPAVLKIKSRVSPQDVQEGSNLNQTYVTRSSAVDPKEVKTAPGRKKSSGKKKTSKGKNTSSSDSIESFEPVLNMQVDSGKFIADGGINGLGKKRKLQPVKTNFFTENISP